MKIDVLCFMFFGLTVGDEVYHTIGTLMLPAPHPTPTTHSKAKKHKKKH